MMAPLYFLHAVLVSTHTTVQGWETVKKISSRAGSFAIVTPIDVTIEIFSFKVTNLIFGNDIVFFATISIVPICMKPIDISTYAAINGDQTRPISAAFATDP